MASCWLACDGGVACLRGGGVGWGGAGRGSGWQLLRTVLDQEAIERIERIILERAIKVPATTLTTHGPPPPL